MASNPQHEPTMEEILASIRKIISEDSNEAQPVHEAKPGNGAAPVAATVESDVYELHEAEIVEEPHQALEPQPTVVPMTPEPSRVMQMPVPPKPENDIVFQPREESPVTASVSPAPAETHSEATEGFFSDNTRRAMHDTFARLDPGQDEAPSAQPAQTFSAEGASVQAVFEHAIRDSFGPLATQYLHGNIDLIVERMKPLVREWMDEHFPAILEGAVRNEVERAVKAAASSKARR